MKTSESLSRAPEAVFRIWSNRLRIEIEAAAVFGDLATQLSEWRGPEDEVAKLCLEARDDELRHAQACREILKFSSKKWPASEHPVGGELGPADLSLEDRVLYTCVAIGCVTETLSTALLIEMRNKAAAGLIRDTVQSILVDEVNHSRIGWAKIAKASQTRDVRWLSAHIPAMIQAALVSDVGPMLDSTESKVDLSEWGILPPAQSKKLMSETVQEVILPGLRQYGVS